MTDKPLSLENVAAKALDFSFKDLQVVDNTYGDESDPSGTLSYNMRKRHQAGSAGPVTEENKKPSNVTPKFKT